MGMIGSTVGAVLGGGIIGSVIGGLFRTKSPKLPNLPAQKLGELSQQTAKEGDPRPIVYGIGRPIGGNIMYMSQPIKRMVKTFAGTTTTGGGKGGGKKKQKTVDQYQDVEHVYRYYAIRVCEGPITGYRRIWRNGALVYDGRKGSAWGAKNNHLFFKTYRLYTGSWTQTPDSVLQSRQGMNIPAYRGTAYLVANNEDLTDFGGAIPQWQFEVVRSEGYYLTSRPYNLESGESVWLSAGSSGVRNSKVFIDEDVGVEKLGLSAGASRLNLRSAVADYIADQPEEINLSAGASRLNLRSAVTDYIADQPEEINLSAGASRLNLSVVVIPYTVNEPEEINLSAGAARIYLNEN